MKIVSLVMSHILLVMSLTGCASLKKATTQVETVGGRAILPPYSGPKARITVADFEVRVVMATGEVDLALREMLVTTLINSNRFLVVERQAADLIITTAITEFEPQASGGRAGVGGGGGVGSGILGGLLGVALNKTYMVLDIRIIDTLTSKVLAINRVQAQASDTTEAKRACIIEAVRYISEAVPARYYKY